MPRAPAEDSSPDSGSTARWSPNVRGAAPDVDARGRAPRPRFSATLALWAPEPEAGEPVADTEPLVSSLDELRESHLCQVGSLEHIPRSGVASHEIGSLGLEHRLSFMLSLVDGTSSVAEILETCGLDELDALGLLAQLEEQGLAAFFKPRH